MKVSKMVSAGLAASASLVASMVLMLPPMIVKAATPTQVERGRYLVRLGGCNDCHTGGYSEAAGKLPESQWLTGQPVGYKGPWGVTYPANLRLLAQKLSAEEWNLRLQRELRPPMPWFTLRALSDADRGAIYQFIRSLGPAGQPAPDYVAPGGVVKTPFILFVPQPPSMAATNLR